MFQRSTRCLRPSVRKEIAITQQLCIFDFMLIKPKYVWELHFEVFCKQTANEHLLIVVKVKHILILPTYALAESEKRSFRVIAIHFLTKWSCSPCTM